MTDLSFGQWIRLGIGFMSWANRNRTAIDEAIAVWQSVVPAETKDGISHTKAIEKIRTGEMTEDEQRAFDRETQASGL